jgi:hypothetical protein
VNPVTVTARTGRKTHRQKPSSDSTEWRFGAARITFTAEASALAVGFGLAILRCDHRQRWHSPHPLSGLRKWSPSMGLGVGAEQFFFKKKQDGVIRVCLYH